MPSMDPKVQILVGILFILIGGSFAYKAYKAAVKGQMYFWDGFLPFTLASPFLIHLPPGKRSLVKTKEGLFVHLIMGPMFMFLSIILIAGGADLIDPTGSHPGTYAINWMMSGGHMGTPAIVFDKHSGYKFPIVARFGGKFAKRFLEPQIQIDQKDQMVQVDNSGGYNSAVGNASK